MIEIPSNKWYRVALSKKGVSYLRGKGWKSVSKNNTTLAKGSELPAWFNRGFLAARSKQTKYVRKVMSRGY